MKGLFKGCKGLAWRPGEFLVAVDHQGQGVVIAAQKAVDAVLFNTRVGPACRGAFSAQPPAHLVQRDVIVVLPARLTAQLVSGGQRGNAAPQDRDFLALGTFCFTFCHF